MNHKNRIASLGYQLATIIIQLNIIIIVKYLFSHLILAIKKGIIIIK
jgi:hypothetical protein